MILPTPQPETATTDRDALIKQIAGWAIERNPTAIYPCSCGVFFPIRQHPTLVCPACNTAPDKAECDRLCAAIVADDPNALAREKPEDEPPAEVADRCDPPRLDDVIGNPAAVMQIRTALDAHRGRCAKGTDGKHKPVFPHILLTGSGGTGKTMLSEIIAREVKRPIRIQMGQSLNSPARVADVLLSLKAGDVLFIDEIHGLKPVCQETLYRAMEDGVLVPIAKAGAPVEKPIRLPPFTLIGSTTDEWELLPSLVQRFKYRIRLSRMAPAELAVAIAQRAERKGWTLDAESAGMIAARAHGTPRLAVGLLDGCMDTAIAQGHESVNADVVRMTCAIWQIDRLGLDAVARKYLGFLADANGGPVRLNVLATKLDGLARSTVERKIEPDLVWIGLIEKDADGRSLTDAGRDYMKSQG